MRKDRDNPLALSPKRPCQSRTDYGRELERLRADLEAERRRTQRARGHLSVELRRLRQEAEREQQRAVRELTARPWSQKDRHSDRRRRPVAKEVNVKDAGRHSKDEFPGKEAVSSCSGETRTKLELLLLRLYEEINGEQAVHKLHPRQEFELEKSIFLCQLLETHGRRLQAGQRAGPPSSVFKSLSRKPTQEDGDKSCQRHPRSPIASHSAKKNTKQDQQKQSPGRALCAADPCTTAAVVDTCQSGSLKICHPHSTPHAGRDDQPPSCSESSGSDESSPSKCMDRNMERYVKNWNNAYFSISGQAPMKPPLSDDRARVMYDLCTRPEQPEPAPAHAGMESREEAEAPGRRQQEFRTSEEQVNTQHGLLDKAAPTTAHVTSTSLLGKRHHSLYANLNGFEVEGICKNGTDYGFLVRQNSELLRALDELEKTCTTLREENGLLRKSSAPETEEKVRRLRRKNTELAVLAKRLEERARKLQEANLKVVNSPSLMRPGSVEQYKRAFARQRARDLAQHADALLSKDKEIAALQQECREMEARLGTTKGSAVPSGRVEFEKALRESQREVLRLQRQLSVTSSTRQQNHSPDPSGPEKCGDTVTEDKVVGETPCVALDEAPSRCEKTPAEEESWLQVTPPPGLSPTPSHQEEHTEEQRLQFLESELSKKRKECENLEHEVKKRQKRCLDLESQLEDERSKNEQLKEEADLLRRKAQLLDQTRAENEELREDLSEVTAQHNSVLEENQRLRAKLENLEQVLKHMREVAERRQQLELEHEQALAILKFKQDEIKRLQRAQLYAKREHEGVVQMLEVRDLEDKCRSQSEQFGLLSQELDKFRLQASKVDLAGTTILNNPTSLSALTNGVGLTTERDVAAALRMGATPHAAGLSRVERSPVTKHRELPTINVSKSGSSSSKSETTHLTPKSDTHLSPHKSSPTHEVDTASEVEELDIDLAPAPYTASRGAAKLQVFIARYSYNPYDGPNDNPEVELPLTAGEYIYVYGDMDDDGFYEGPPDAPLDVQLEHGPSPGIALISWLPVTIDAAGTSNGVRVTGYTIYADRKKVLEVSSPTAGSALLGPSQIQSLQAAQELTVRTTSAHGESCDSLPVNVPSKLVAIMAGPAISAPAVPPPLPCAPVGPSSLPSSPSYMNYAAKVSMLPSTLPSDAHNTGLVVEAAANSPNALHSEDLLSSASYVKAWANPSSAAALAVCETSFPVAPTITPEVSVTSPTTSAPPPSPVAAPAPEHAPVMAAAAVLEQRRDTDSPGTIRPFPSITEFIEDASAKLETPEHIPLPPKAPITDVLNAQDTNLLRPPSTSPQDSEVDEERENSRLVSMEEFLRQDQEPAYSARQQSYGRGLVEPPSDYHADNSRSDLSDILEEEEEDLYSDHFGEAQARGYTVGARRSRNLEPPDSDEEVLERILKLPPQVYNNKQLFIIPEVTDEEDSGREELFTHRSQPRPRTGQLHPRDSERLHHGPQHHQHHPNPQPHVHPHHHHFNTDPRSLTKEPSPRHGPMRVKPRTQQRVHYADTVDTISYPEDEDSLYEGPTGRRCPPQPTSNSRVLLRGLGDRLRREAMLRSQRAVATAGNLSHGPVPPRPHPVSKTGRTPVGHEGEIDVEYGTDDNEEPAEYGPGEAAMEHMNSECSVDLTLIGDHFTPPPSREQRGVNSAKVKGDGDVIRIFVALFPYDPSTMSPNPDAAEEELPFSEGQIIKVYGDKDADGFYQGESSGRLGYVPCNMVSEIQVEDEETRQQLLQQGYLSTAASMEKIDPSQPAPVAVKASVAPGARRMVAIFDYDPRESSPNTDIEAELTFSAGDVIHVFGDMDEDGFFYGDLNGHRGLVPSNFLQAFPEDAPAEHLHAQPAPEQKRESQGTGASSTAPQHPGCSTAEESSYTQTEPPLPHPTTHTDPPSKPAPSASPTSDLAPALGPAIAPAAVEVCCSRPAPLPVDSPTKTDSPAQGKKKKGFFSKGKKLFKKLGSSKKE
ncbi:hypothetical protein F2P81_008565 [Scophthalmus maximus]|uniref:SH3 domain-containing protein n=1 Tax=Scophthalmus maximus TaxID=52904 RepID=A0A6A4T4G1_SCOMX|nr:hypothetical protein F2P81_008565 [Scophthalmus maximus]